MAKLKNAKLKNAKLKRCSPTKLLIFLCRYESNYFFFTLDRFNFDKRCLTLIKDV
jgi:hypothetical protein